MALAQTAYRTSALGRLLATRLIEATDLRLAGGLMLVLALLRPLIPFETGILCPLRAVTGVPCPLCGMTTSVTAVTQLDLAGAFSANPVGIVAVVAALYLLVRRPRYVRVSLPVVLLALGAMWIFELNRYGII